MAKWRALVRLGDEMSTMYTEAKSYSAAYVQIIGKLPSRCARGDCKDGIIRLVQDTEEASEPFEDLTELENG